MLEQAVPMSHPSLHPWAGTNCVLSWTMGLTVVITCLLIACWPKRAPIPTGPTLALGITVLTLYPLPGMLWYGISLCTSVCMLGSSAPSHIHCLDARTWALAYGWTSWALHKGSQPRGHAWGLNPTCALLTEPETLLMG